jgi:hypothetical protein
MQKFSPQEQIQAINSQVLIDLQTRKKDLPYVIPNK